MTLWSVENTYLKKKFVGAGWMWSCSSWPCAVIDLVVA